MKKIIIFTICICIIVEIVVTGAFMYLSQDECSEKLVVVAQIILQAILSGVVTFVGLFFTILSQERQANDSFILQQRPCFIIDPPNYASVKSVLSEITTKQSLIICHEDGEVRTSQCVLKNVKDNYGINVFIRSENSNLNYIGNFSKDYGKNVQLVLKAQEDGEFWVEFEDVYGNKYKQKINYKYLDGQNKYQFFSNQPQRRK